MPSLKNLSRVTLALAVAVPIISFGASPTDKTRSEVKRELADFRANPIASDGFRWVGGEIGWARPLSSANHGQSRNGIQTVAQRSVQRSSQGSACEEMCAGHADSYKE